MVISTASIATSAWGSQMSLEDVAPRLRAMRKKSSVTLCSVRCDHSWSFLFENGECFLTARITSSGINSSIALAVHLRLGNCETYLLHSFAISGPLHTQQLELHVEQLLWLWPFLNK